jgi:hypothetical protein
MNSKTGEIILGRSSTVDPAGISTAFPGDASIKGTDKISPSGTGVIDSPIPDRILGSSSLLLLHARRKTNNESKIQNTSGKIDNSKEANHKFQARDSEGIIQDILVLITSAVI